MRKNVKACFRGGSNQCAQSPAFLSARITEIRLNISGMRFIPKKGAIYTKDLETSTRLTILFLSALTCNGRRRLESWKFSMAIWSSQTTVNDAKEAFFGMENMRTTRGSGHTYPTFVLSFYHLRHNHLVDVILSSSIVHGEILLFTIEIIINAIFTPRCCENQRSQYLTTQAT